MPDRRSVITGLLASAAVPQVASSAPLVAEEWSDTFTVDSRLLTDAWYLITDENLKVQRFIVAEPPSFVMSKGT